MNTASKFAGIFVTAYIARYLGPSQLGYFSFVISVAGLLILIFGFGLDGYVQRAIASNLAKRNTDEVRRVVSESLGVILISSLVMVFVAGILGIFAQTVLHRESAIPLFSLAGLYGAVLLIGMFLGSILTAYHRLDVALPYALLRDVFRVIFVLILVKITGSFISAVIGYILAFGAYALFMYRVVGKFVSVTPRPDLHIIFKSLPYFFFGLASVFLTYIDILMLSYFRPMSEVGYYRSAYLIVSAVIALLPFVAVSLPTLSRAAALKKIRQKYFQLMLIVLGVSAVVLPLLYVFGPHIIVALYGDGYLVSVPIFRVLLLLIPAYFVYSLSIQAIISLGREWEQILYPLAAGILNFVFNYLLIPRYGALGAACATVGSMLFAAILATGRLLLISRVRVPEKCSS